MTQGQCPSCGAPVEFTAGSAQVVVCSYCQTVVAKKGANLEAHGRISAIVDTDSPLRLGLEALFSRVRDFTRFGYTDVLFPGMDDADD